MLVDEDQTQLAFTPQYAAPEVLDGGVPTAASDLASLGYVLIELLAGQPPFKNETSFDELKHAKLNFEGQVQQLLPSEVLASDVLMNLIRTLTQPDPDQRFQSAEAADLLEDGAAGFHRQLVAGTLDSQYETEIRRWLDELQ